MAIVILADTTASVSELKKNPMLRTVAADEGFPVAILNRNEPVFYCVPALSPAGIDCGLTYWLATGRRSSRPLALRVRQRDFPDLCVGWPPAA